MRTLLAICLGLVSMHAIAIAQTVAPLPPTSVILETSVFMEAELDEELKREPNESGAAFRERAITYVTNRKLADTEWWRTIAPADGPVMVTSGPIKKGEVFLRAPVRHAMVGRLKKDVLTGPVFGNAFTLLPAGTEVWKIHRAHEYTGNRWESIIWCGKAPANSNRPRLHCVTLPRSDGKGGGATETRGSVYYPEITIIFIREATLPDIEPRAAIDIPAMEITLEFSGWRNNKLQYQSYITVGDERTPIHSVTKVAADERGELIDVWGGKLLLKPGDTQDSAVVDVISPVGKYDPHYFVPVMREEATRTVDENKALAKQFR